MEIKLIAKILAVKTQAKRRTSENPIQAKFADYPFYEVRCIA